MAYSTSLTSYPDIVNALQRALDSNKGVRLYFESAQSRMTFCGRVHSFRYHDRKLNARTYPADHPMSGRSAFDGLMVRKKEVVEREGKTTWPVEIIRLEGVEFDIEELQE